MELYTYNAIYISCALAFVTSYLNLLNKDLGIIQATSNIWRCIEESTHGHKENRISELQDLQYNRSSETIKYNLETRRYIRTLRIRLSLFALNSKNLLLFVVTRLLFLLFSVLIITSHFYLPPLSTLHNLGCHFYLYLQLIALASSEFSWSFQLLLPL